MAATEVFAAQGFVNATVDDIVARVEVARGTFYLYFDDKLDVFSALVDDFFVRIAASIKSIDLDDVERSPRVQLRDNIGRVLDIAIAEKAMVRIALSTAMGVDTSLDEKLRVFYSTLRRFMTETLQTGQEIGLVRDGDRELMVTIALGGFKELMLDTVTGTVERSRTQLVDAVMTFLNHGLLAPPP